ncbi:MAG: redox-regulated ATPase YchF [Nitrososphaerales archaeon]|nr:redox-regulated ATPase YchF [Nitrososphaerales archaeon]
MLSMCPTICMILGVIGKPNVGKSTFFNAATLLNVPMASYPFTTIEPNFGVAYVSTHCICRTLNVEDNPVNSRCINGTRLIPIKLVDIAGLVRGAAEGRGLGNKFLDDIRQVDALIHVVDASGLTDEEGVTTEEVIDNPITDIDFVEKEFDLWLRQLLLKDWRRISNNSESNTGKTAEMISERLSGLAITEKHILTAAEKKNLTIDKPTSWSEDDIMNFCISLRELSKPSIIAANKIDNPFAKENIEHIKATGRLFVPCAAEAELLLRKAAEIKMIDYLAGGSTFKMLNTSNPTIAQVKALEMVKKNVLDIWGSTGVQTTINSAYLDLLDGIVVYPVEDENKLSDKKGNILPDAYIVQKGSTAKDLAFIIHSDLGETFLHAFDVKTGLQLGADYILKDSDVIKIVSRYSRG